MQSTQNDMIEHRVQQLQADLNTFRKIIEEQNAVIKNYARDQDIMKTNLHSYLGEIEKLKKENDSLKFQVESVNTSNLSNLKNPNRSLNSLSINEASHRISHTAHNPPNNHISSLPLLDEDLKNDGQALSSKTEAKLSSALHHHASNGKEKFVPANAKNNLASRTAHHKIKLDARDIDKSNDNSHPFHFHSLLDNRLPRKELESTSAYHTYTPKVPKRFFTLKNSDKTIHTKELKRCESTSSRIVPSNVLQEIDYKDYLAKVTQAEKADKIQFLIDLCRPNEKLPSLKTNLDIQHRERRNALPLMHDAGHHLAPDRNPLASTLKQQILFKEDMVNIKSRKSTDLHNRASAPLEKISHDQAKPSILSQFSKPLDFVKEAKGPNVLARKTVRKDTSSFSYQSLSEDNFSRSNIDKFTIKELSPVKSLYAETIDLHKIYEDFLIVGCQKQKLSSYIEESDIAFSIIFDLYALDPKDPNNQNSELLKFLIPFSQKIRSVKIKNTVGKLNEILFQDEASCKNFEFFSISLNSNIAGSPGENYRPTDFLFKNGDLGLLKETNPNLCYYYYCAKIEDFFIDTQSAKKFTTDIIEFSFFPKYFVIKTLYPFSQFFYNVLQQIISLSKRKRIERFMDSIKGGRVDIETLERLDSNGIMDIELGAVMPLFEQMDLVRLGNNFEEPIRLEIPNVSIKYALPSIKSCSFVEAEFGFARILSQFAFEDFLFIFFSMMLENTIVFVSEEMSNLSACISAFVALFKPFKWPFPIIYSLPEDCLVMLGSPIPLIVGINLPADTVINDVLPEHDKKTRPEAFSNIYVFIDHNLFYYDFDTFDSMLIPQYDEFVEKLEKLYKKSFSARPSSYFKLEKKKKNKSSYTYLKKINTTKLKEKLVKLDKASQAKSLDKSQFEKFRYSSVIKSAEEFSVFHFFRYFFNSFIISKLPHDRTISHFGKETRIKEIDINFFSTNPSDVEFLEAFMKTQSFMYYIENDFYGITNGTVDK